MKQFCHSFLTCITIAYLFSGCGDTSSVPGPPPSPETPPVPSSNIEQKIHNYKEALKENPQNLAVLIGLGNLLMDNSRYTDAIVEYQQALKIVPEDVNVRVDMGTCYRKIGQPERALEEYRKSLSYQPNHVNALANMGVVLAYDMDDPDGALEAWEQVLKLDPNHPMAAQIHKEIERIQSTKKGNAPGSHLKY